MAVEPIICLQPSVKTITFVCLELVVTDMEGLKCASVVLGVLSVMISGATLMPVWCVDSWDSPHMVSCFAQFITCIDFVRIGPNYKLLSTAITICLTV